jgi:hypothetical protein
MLFFSFHLGVALIALYDFELALFIDMLLIIFLREFFFTTKVTAHDWHVVTFLQMIIQLNVSEFLIALIIWTFDSQDL